MSTSEQIAAVTYGIQPRLTVPCGEGLTAEAPRGSLRGLVGERYVEVRQGQSACI